MALLNKGLKYSLYHKDKHRLSNLTLEAEAALTPLSPPQQEHIRHQVAHNHRKLYKHHNNTPSPKTPRNEMKIVNQIKKNLSDANAMVTEADKGNSMIIIYESDYTSKVQDFISNSNFELVPRDVTNKLQRDIKNTINECKVNFHKQNKWKYTSLKPTTPTLRSLIKIHKAESPIRPVVNWMNTPAYKPAKMLVKLLQTHTPLPYTFNVTNSTHLVNDLADIAYDHKLRLASFDISNMYTNIPTHKPLSIIDTACNNNLVEERLKRDINLSKTTIDQNYFQFKDMTYKQHEGLAMGAPTSSIFSEFYLQYQENSRIYDILRIHITGYFRYVDNILIIHDDSTTNIEDFLQCFNNLTPKLKFTLEKEVGHRINFLDLTIHREHNKSLQTFTGSRPSRTPSLSTTHATRRNIN